MWSGNSCKLMYSEVQIFTSAVLGCLPVPCLLRSEEWGLRCWCCAIAAASVQFVLHCSSPARTVCWDTKTFPFDANAERFALKFRPWTFWLRPQINFKHNGSMVIICLFSGRMHLVFRSIVEDSNSWNCGPFTFVDTFERGPFCFIPLEFSVSTSPKCSTPVVPCSACRNTKCYEWKFHLISL